MSFHVAILQICEGQFWDGKTWYQPEHWVVAILVGSHLMINFCCSVHLWAHMHLSFCELLARMNTHFCEFYFELSVSIKTKLLIRYMQAVVDEIVFGNADPLKVVAISLYMLPLITTFFYWLFLIYSIQEAGIWVSS